jgi:hypothetical protein
MRSSLPRPRTTGSGRSRRSSGRTRWRWWRSARWRPGSAAAKGAARARAMKRAVRRRPSRARARRAIRSFCTWSRSRSGSTASRECASWRTARDFPRKVRGGWPATREWRWWLGAATGVRAASRPRRKARPVPPARQVPPARLAQPAGMGMISASAARPARFPLRFAARSRRGTGAAAFPAADSASPTRTTSCTGPTAAARGSTT